MNLKLKTEEARKKLQRVKLLVLDVDGVLTDGSLFFSGDKEHVGRIFDVRDGFGIMTLQKAGVPVAIVSAGKEISMKGRFEVLGIEHMSFGSQDKLPAVRSIQEKLGVSDEETAYMADELFDLPVLETVGVSVTVPEAPLPVKKRVEFISSKPGGKGAVRELCDAIRWAQGIGPYSEEF